MMHEITVRQFYCGRTIWYRAECSCGTYRSKPRGYVSHAEQAGQAHVDAKKGSNA